MARVTILILAAGASARMRGADKLLQMVDGQPQLRRIAMAALATGSAVIVTLPADNPARRAALQMLPVEILPLVAPEEGMSASIRAGAQAAKANEALMIVPADMPEIDATDLKALIAAHKMAPTALLRGATHGTPGHPVLFPQDLVADLHRLRGDTGARALTGAHEARLHLVPLPGHHATLDLDTPEEWDNWTRARVTALPPATEHPSMRDPLSAAAQRPDDAVLAVITDVVGAAYRKPGAMMALFSDGALAGSLTNGCIEGDLALHAVECRSTGKVAHLRYGAGSPFFDIRLPCGGGLSVTLFPHPDPLCLDEIERLRAQRQFLSLCFDQAGNIRVQPSQATGWHGETFAIDLPPPLRFAIFGEGPEAVVFARLAHSAGYPHHLITPSIDTYAAAQQSGCTVDLQGGTAALPPNDFDARTAVVTFFHDHGRELPILQSALQSAAFYVGAQGSLRVAQDRLTQLRDAGLPPDSLSRLHAPIGLIRSARDPVTLAVSVLAEVVQASIAPTA